MLVLSFFVMISLIVVLIYLFASEDFHTLRILQRATCTILMILWRTEHPGNTLDVCEKGKESGRKGVNQAARKERRLEPTQQPGPSTQCSHQILLVLISVSSAHLLEGDDANQLDSFFFVVIVFFLFNDLTRGKKKKKDNHPRCLYDSETPAQDNSLYTLLLYARLESQCMHLNSLYKLRDWGGKFWGGLCVGGISVVVF